MFVAIINLIRRTYRAAALISTALAAEIAAVLIDADRALEGLATTISVPICFQEMLIIFLFAAEVSHVPMRVHKLIRQLLLFLFVEMLFRFAGAGYHHPRSRRLLARLFLNDFGARPL